MVLHEQRPHKCHAELCACPLTHCRSRARVMLAATVQFVVNPRGRPRELRLGNRATHVMLQARPAACVNVVSGIGLHIYCFMRTCHLVLLGEPPALSLKGSVSLWRCPNDKPAQLRIPRRPTDCDLVFEVHLRLRWGSGCPLPLSRTESALRRACRFTFVRPGRFLEPSWAPLCRPGRKNGGRRPFPPAPRSSDRATPALDCRPNELPAGASTTSALCEPART